MADLYNDQEQVDMIKNWWRRHGNTLLTVIVVVAIIVVGYQWWQRRENAQLSNASMAYQSLLSSVNANDVDSIQAKAQAIIKASPKSAYAGLSAMIWAASDVRQGHYTQAKSQLQWVIAHQKETSLVDLAKVRLARLELQDQQAAKAIKVLTPVSNIYTAASQLTLGDAYLQEKRYKSAKTAYQASLKALPKGDPLTAYVTLKLHNLPQNSSTEGSV